MDGSDTLLRVQTNDALLTNDDAPSDVSPILDQCGSNSDNFSTIEDSEGDAATLSQVSPRDGERAALSPRAWIRRKRGGVSSAQIVPLVRYHAYIAAYCSVCCLSGKDAMSLASVVPLLVFV